MHGRNLEEKTCLDCCAVAMDEEEGEPEINLIFLKVIGELGYKP